MVYEVLEEMLDNGFPLATESNILKELIKPPTILRTVVNTITGESGLWVWVELQGDGAPLKPWHLQILENLILPFVCCESTLNYSRMWKILQFLCGSGW